MKDSILKGAGNSRFLKSAVPAGTSWADALAMLQAGTFPIDFNGINAEGFQQVGTPLNKANLLKDATAAQIGLPPSTTPDGMFQALGNTGELHVWRKTVTSGTGTTTTYPVSTNPNAYKEGDDAKPAGYVVGDAVTGSFLMGASVPVATNDFYYTDAPTVSDNGVISVPTENTPKISVGYKTNFDASTLNVLRGKFVFLSGDGRCDPIFYSVIYVPSDAVFTKADWDGELGYRYYLDKYQPVTGYPAIPAGTIIEYLGKLGDKARVQVVSYVGTGTYGKSNPNSLTFDFVPKVVMIRRGGDAKIFDAIYGMRDVTVVLSARYYVTVEWSKKTLSWYSPNSASEQMNYAGDKYYAAAIG